MASPVADIMTIWFHTKSFVVWGELMCLGGSDGTNHQVKYTNIFFRPKWPCSCPSYWNLPIGGCDVNMIAGHLGLSMYDKVIHGRAIWKLRCN